MRLDSTAALIVKQMRFSKERKKKKGGGKRMKHFSVWSIANAGTVLWGKKTWFPCFVINSNSAS